ncbi:MAG: efflux RND transporter permease subunit [Acidobacteriales bacterium]|nr:efflux RND transporter permease subunit [Terriglobales bacterium]
MWLVRLALRRPYTFAVAAVLIAILGVYAIVSMPTDIFPNIDIPVVSAIWSYSGIPPEEMSGRIATICERALTTTVDDIEHIESQSYPGVTVIRVYLHPSAKVEMAVAQVTAGVQPILRGLPPGIFPPNIIRYNASSVPILQLSVNSRTMPEQALFDYGQNFIRTQLITVQGAAIPLPYGGKFRNIMVDLDPQALFAKRLSATDVSQAINLQNLILPAGNVKVGDREYFVKLNSSPTIVAALNDLPIKTVDGATVFIKDVAQVRDGNSVQTNIVRHNGKRAALLTVLKSGGASTLDIVNGIKRTLPRIMSGLPSELNVQYLLDQSLFVRAAINGLVRESVIAAVLTGLMILLFLGSWRSTLTVCISIPLSILTSLAVLYFCKQTINAMTLGGLGLAVGILVDDATVTIENIHRNMQQKKPLTRAILDGAQQIAVPALVSTLSICIVFVPVLLLTGPARYLFTALAMAVVFAMLASYVLSRTLVPAMVHYLCASEVEVYAKGEDHVQVAGFIWRVHHVFNNWFERARDRYVSALAWMLAHRRVGIAAFLLLVAVSLPLAWFVGEDFFPDVDSGQMRLHVRTPPGTRIEETERIFGLVEGEIRRELGGELSNILDNIGLPVSGINLALSNTATIGPGDGEILISLNEDHSPTEMWTSRLRRRLRDKFPDLDFFFQPANITNQILNFGLPAPVDIQVVGRNAKANYQIARRIQSQLERVPGAADVHIHQGVDYPEFRVNVDRAKASQVGLTQRDVANSLLISLSSSGQVAPNQWLNPVNGVNYQISVQTPQYRVNSFDELARTPIASPSAPPQLLSNLATFGRGVSTALVSHYNVQPVFDVYANVERTDLGTLSREVDRIVRDVTPSLPKGAFIDVRGQVETMRTSFFRLGLGVSFAVILVYLLMVVNFQSWLDPFIILMAIPGALTGIIWILFITQTTFSVPSLMGAIMTIGVATANSILVVTFANDERMSGKSALEAALSAGHARVRPVIMTASAMIIGMLPMALGFGEGGEQNAPLGRAVIGGLIVATFATLFFVPVVYSYLRKTPPSDLDRKFQTEEREEDLQ